MEIAKRRSKEITSSASLSRRPQEKERN